MKKTNKIIPIFLLVVALILPIALYYSNNAAKTYKKSIYVNQTCSVGVKVSDKSVKVKWSLSNNKVAKIVRKTSNGAKKSVKIKGLKPGKMTLKATYKKKGKKVVEKFVIVVQEKKKGSNSVNKDAFSSSQSNGVDVASTQNRGLDPGQAEAPKNDPTVTQKPENTPLPTAPEEYSIELKSTNSFIENEYNNADVTFNDDGSVTIVFDNQYEAVNFFLPGMKNAKYTSVTIDYSSTGNNLMYTLYEGSLGFAPDSEWKDNAKRPNWSVDIVTGTDIKKSINNTDVIDCKTIRGIGIMNLANEGKTTITIKKIVFHM